ncbi:MAG: MFS transporter [Sumerlaeia bacterium]
MHDPQGELTNPLWLLTLPQIWVFAAVALYFPVFPLFFREVGMSDGQIAVLFAVPGMIGFLALQSWGYVADVLLNRKWVLLVMSLLAAGVAALFPYFTSFWALFFLSALRAFFSDARIPMVQSLTLANRGGEKHFGPIRLFGTFSFIGLAWLVGWWADRPGGPGIFITFPLLIVMNLAMVVTMFFVKGAPRGHVHQQHEMTRPGFWHVQRTLLANPVVRTFLLFLFVYQLPHNISHGFQSVLIQDLGGDNSAAIWPVNIAAIAEIPVFIFAAGLLKKVRIVPLLLVGAIAQVLRWSLVAAVPSIPVIYASNLFHALTFGIMYLGAVMLMNREIPKAYRSSGQTLMTLVYSSMAGMLGPLTSAVAFRFIPGEENDVHLWYWVAAAIAACSIPLWFLVARAYRERHGTVRFWIGEPVSVSGIWRRGSSRSLQ